MRIGILSDTHDKLERTKIAIQMLCDVGVEVLFHCGDLASPPIVEACSCRPCYFTFGNHDADDVRALQKAAVECGVNCLGWGDVVELSGKRLGLVHGHLTTDLRRVVALQPDYLFSGHSHSRNDAQVGAIRRINPGALHRADEFSVAILDLKAGSVQFLSVPR
jgi:putative phosphoesterase